MLQSSLLVLFFFLMIRRPPRSTPLSLHDALPISSGVSDTAPREVPMAPAPSPTGVPVQRRGSPDVDVLVARSEEHTSELQSRQYLVCRLLLEKKQQAVARSCAWRPASQSTVLESR